METGPKLELAAERLGEDLGVWALRHRNDDRSWYWIARKLQETTGVSITPQWLGQVYGNRTGSDAASTDTSESNERASA
jgi:hypothetical protein